MKRDFDRADCFNDVIHRALAEILSKEFKDPRVGMVTVSEVDVAKDLTFIRIYVTVLQEGQSEETLKILNAAVGFFRRRLASMVKIRVMPKIAFYHDDSLLVGRRICKILDNEE